MSVLKKCGIFVLISVSVWLFASNASALVTIVSPTEGQVFYGSAITLSVKLQHTANYDVGVAFEARQLYIPGQWPDTWKSESVQVLSKTEVSPEITLMSVAIPKGGSWRMRASEQPKQAPKPGISGPWREFLVIAPGQKTVGASLTVSPVSYAGKCPVQVYFNGKIGSAIKGDVKYVFIRSWNSVTTPVQTLKFDVPGAIDVTTNFPVDTQQNPSIPAAGWVAIKILGNPEIISNHADYKVTCQYPDLEVVSISGIPELFAGDVTSYESWKIKIRNKGNGDAEPMEARLRCEPVAGSGPGGLTPSCPDMFKHTGLNYSKLEAGKEIDTAFFPATFTEKWKAGKYRVIAEADYNNKVNDTDKSNNQKTVELMAKWTPITDVQIKWTAQSYKGTCPANDIPLMSGELSANGLGKVQFQYASNTNPNVGTFEHIFMTPGEKFPVGIKTATSATTPNTSGWYQVKVLSPVAKESAKAAYTIECLQFSIDPGWLKNLKTTFSGWNSLEKLSPPPQACQGCVTIFNQILVLDKASLPLAQEGEGLVQQTPSGGQNEGKVQRLNQIKGQLDTNMTQRRSLINKYKTQLSDFETLQKRPVAPVQRR